MKFIPPTASLFKKSYATTKSIKNHGRINAAFAEEILVNEIPQNSKTFLKDINHSTEIPKT